MARWRKFQRAVHGAALGDKLVQFEGKTRIALRVSDVAAQGEEMAEILLAPFDRNAGLLRKRLCTIAQRAWFGAASTSLRIGAQTEGLFDPARQRMVLKGIPVQLAGGLSSRAARNSAFVIDAAGVA
jgi:hypothetical protein